MSIEMIQVSSSNIQAIGWDEQSETLRIEFHGGRIYQFEDFPSRDWEEFKSAPSHGRYFNSHIKGVFQSTLVSS